jgi:hypothetical protein
MPAFIAESSRYSALNGCLITKVKPPKHQDAKEDADLRLSWRLCVLAAKYLIVAAPRHISPLANHQKQ